MNQLVVVEGPDGSGKSTLARLLANDLKKRGIACTLLREPGGTPLGESIREILRDPSREIDSRSETLLFCAARAALAGQIRNLLEKSWVILDRYEGSTAVYQGIVRGLDPNKVLEISRWASEDLRPDYTLVVEVDPQTSIERRKNRTSLDRMEETTDLEAVLDGYEWLARQPGAFRVSGRGTPEDALRESLQILGLNKDKK